MGWFEVCYPNSQLISVATKFIDDVSLPKNSIEAIDNHGWFISHAIASGSAGAKVIEEIAHALALADIELQQYSSYSEVASDPPPFLLYRQQMPSYRPAK